MDLPDLAAARLLRAMGKTFCLLEQRELTFAMDWLVEAKPLNIIPDVDSELAMGSWCLYRLGLYGAHGR